MKRFLKLWSVMLQMVAVTFAVARETDQRWTITDDGGICWIVGDSLPHYDHIEMSGEKVSTVLRYGVNNEGCFSIERSVVWPMLRTVPNNTHASLTRRFAHDFLMPVMADRQTLNNESVKSITLDGKMKVTSTFTVGHNRATKSGRTLSEAVQVERIIFPSTTLPMICEDYTLTNIDNKNLEIVIPAQRLVYSTPAEQGVDGSYKIIAKTTNNEDIKVNLKPGESISFGATIQGYKPTESELSADVKGELLARKAFVDRIGKSLVFECPDKVLNTEFAFAKIRAAESIFRTKGGLMQSPGGESYYAAIWANDQAEYLNPFLPYLGYDKGNESAVNSFRHFARFMNEEYRTIPSSIIAEGDDIWNGAGDRGDCAMIGYGASRFALAYGDRKTAEDLFPLIEWCLEYSRRKTNEEGVVASNTDELEGRFPSGDANLCTSSLHYDALLSGAFLATELGKTKQAAKYRAEAIRLRKSIERYFGSTVEGFDTYRYYKGNKKLRSWICMPLVTGIFERKDATINALLSPRLKTADGLLTQSGTDTYWDRSTLYALRGIFAAGQREKALEFLSYYSRTRLLGNHVPYPIEAWPEGNQRHLSTESALYCRIITEGMFGIRPTGLSKFEMTPQLPQGWNYMSLRNVAAFNSEPYDIVITRAGDKLDVKIIQQGKVTNSKRVANGQKLTVACK
ncbi:MAG: hypothetical protein NC343_07595 [Muribaculum sp.]|nr:hypothetical protein [Muribaculaceae bacterium]MCM1081598.1 hypothetical protein [Muribaculum sp.]